MKVVQINTVPFGCTGRIAFSIKRMIESTGQECIIAYGRGKDSRSGMKKISNTIDVLFHILLVRIFDTSGLHSKYVTKRFVQWLKQNNPDIIHLHNLHGYYINYKILFDYIKKENKKVIWTLHDCWPFTGHCPYYTFVGCEKWKTHCYHCIQKKHHPTSLFFDRSWLNFRDKKIAFSGVRDLTIVTPSKWLANEVRQSFLNEYKTICIPNGINTDYFHITKKQFRKDHLLDDKIVLLGVANLWADTKGLKTFIELSGLLDSRYIIVLVGLTVKQIKKLPSSIIGIKKTNDLSELADLYSSADIFINPTLEDNFPTTQIEALSCGTPIITFNTGGAPEIIERGCGAVVFSNSVEELKDKCLLFGRKSVNIEERCVEIARKYDESRCFKSYLELYSL